MKILLFLTILLVLPNAIASNSLWGYEIKLKGEYLDSGLPKSFISYCHPKESGKSAALVNCMQTIVLDEKIKIIINVSSSNTDRVITALITNIESNKPVLRHFETKTYENDAFSSGRAKKAKDNMYTFEFKLMPYKALDYGK